MNFFVIDPDPEADNDTDLDLAIQTALLNDCPDINQERDSEISGDMGRYSEMWGDLCPDIN